MSVCHRVLPAASVNSSSLPSMPTSRSGEAGSSLVTLHATSHPATRPDGHADTTGSGLLASQNLLGTAPLVLPLNTGVGTRTAPGFTPFVDGRNYPLVQHNRRWP